MRRIAFLIALFCLAAVARLGLAASADPAAQEIVRKVTDATVYIETQVVLSASDWAAAPPAVRKANRRRPQGPASGSGFLISSDGLILTNAHVISGAKQTVQLGPGVTREWHFIPTAIKVVVQSGEAGERSFTPRVLRIDDQADLALLKIPPQPAVQPLPIKSEPLLLAGQQVLMAGFPGGKLPDGAPFASSGRDIASEKNPTVSINAGMVTAVRQRGNDVIYQLDIRANPGNSGGPIVTAAGDIAAVLNAGIPSMQSINYAIPARYFHVVMPGGIPSASAPADPSGEQSYETFKASGTFKLAK